MKLILKNVGKSFKQKDVLKAINFTFEQDKIYGLLGRNGAGKTTLFNCIAQETPISSGEITLDEDGQSQKLGLNDVGYVISTPVVPDFLTGREFIQFFIDLHDSTLENLRTPDEYFDQLHIDYPDRDILMKDYSHGMKNKMQMLVNIVWNPSVLLLDEPLTSFDLVVAQEMKDLLRSVKQGHIMILSTHILEIALDLCDEIVVLVNGQLQLIERADDEKAFKDQILSLLMTEEIDEGN